LPVVNKDHTVWLGGARPPPKYIFLNMSLTNSKILPTWTLQKETEKKVLQVFQEKFTFCKNFFLMSVQFQKVPRTQNFRRECFLTIVASVILSITLIM
jgi:hypothetical protein